MKFLDQANIYIRSGAQGGGLFSALRNPFVPPQTKPTALQIHIFLLNARAEWSAGVMLSC